jgi:hypothetical protein
LARRDDIERALAAKFDREHLAEYGDFLMTEGDPRGELVALDLQIEQHGAMRDLEERRLDVLRAIVGSELVALPFVKLRYGFAELAIDGRTYRHRHRRELDRFLAGALGAFVRRATVRGGEQLLRDAVGGLVRRRHPWLHELRIHYSMLDLDRDERLAVLASGEPVIDKSTTAALVAATPALETLVVTRHTGIREPPVRPIFVDFVHPNARDVEL